VKENLESVRRLSSLKSKYLKSGASLIPLQRADDTGDASKAVALKLKKRDDEIADDARKMRKAEATNTFSKVGLLVTTAADEARVRKLSISKKGLGSSRKPREVPGN